MYTTQFTNSLKWEKITEHLVSINVAYIIVYVDDIEFKIQNKDKNTEKKLVFQRNR